VSSEGGFCEMGNGKKISARGKLKAKEIVKVKWEK